MPLALVYGCEQRDGYALHHFLLYKGFEVRCDPGSSPGEASIVVLAGEGPCPEGIERARIVVASAGRALSCGGRLGSLARGLEPPVSVRVDRDGFIVYHNPGSIFMVFRELARLIRWAGLDYATPPLSQEEILRHKP